MSQQERNADWLYLFLNYVFLLQGVFTSLDVIHTAVYYAATRKMKDSETLALVETAIYVATVDKQNEILKVLSSEMHRK